MKKYLALFVALLLQFNCFGKEKKNYLEIECKKDECFAVAKFNGKKKKLVEVIEYKTSTDWLTNNLAVIRVSCGSPCSTSMFVDFEKNVLSDGYSDVIAIDPKNKIVAYVNEDVKLELAKIFTDKKKVILLDSSKDFSVANVIDKIKFIDSNSIKIDYQAGEERTMKSAIVSIKELNT
ncbi:hypothetical protein [Fluviispira vulneris]|uniref:hypothetical protein n=1 Tax=Fluviispira vulneris TaxID=2763012 RepID=UPI001648514A|nr:hypothetical protein [Fluviispira vulneris]